MIALFLFPWKSYLACMKQHYCNDVDCLCPYSYGDSIGKKYAIDMSIREMLV